MKAPRYKVPHLALRMVREKTLSLPANRISTALDAALVARKVIGDKPVEHLIAILLDGRGNITGVATLAQGGMHGAGVRPADVLRAVLTSHAFAFILAHNHPSNDPTPSADDVFMTNKIRAAAKEVGCPLLAHVVVVRSGDFRTVPESS